MFSCYCIIIELADNQSRHRIWDVWIRARSVIYIGVTYSWAHIHSCVRRNFDVNRNILSLRSFVASFKNISLKSDFIHVCSPRAGTDGPQGTQFRCQQKCLLFHSFVANFKKSLWSLILYIFFHDLINVYSPGAGAEADSPQGTKFWCQQKGLITLPICCKFQRNLFEVWFYTFFFKIYYIYIARGRGHTAPRGQSFYVHRNFLSLRSSVAIFKSLTTTVSEKSIVLPFSHKKAYETKFDLAVK